MCPIKIAVNGFLAVNSYSLVVQTPGDLVSARVRTHVCVWRGGGTHGYGGECVEGLSVVAD